MLFKSLRCVLSVSFRPGKLVDHLRHPFVSPIWQDLGPCEIQLKASSSCSRPARRSSGSQAFVSQQQHINPNQVWVRSPSATLRYGEIFVQKAQRFRCKVGILTTWHLRSLLLCRWHWWDSRDLGETFGEVVWDPISLAD